MKIGTYYYPEQWPREQWERDFDNIAAMGLQIVHMAEFAWFTLEPRPGQFRFEWLDTCMELARQRKLDVILCTPTAAPPIWLAVDQPETLPRDRGNVPARFGGRRHYSPTSSAMKEATARIVTALADHFGRHPSVVGWQIDNEYGWEFDQSEGTHAAFRAWLRKKYDDSIDRLNQAWGCQFWNTYYTSFEQILMPEKPEVVYDNPHQKLDAQRFWSRAWADFNKLQADILKPRIGADRFITTNFMPFYPWLDPGDMRDDLTMYAWDSYPVTGWGSRVQGETYRIADPAGIGFVHEQMASYNGRWSLFEVQPGQVNWSGVPVLLYPGAVRLWLWTAYAHGAEMITVYRFRQPRFGTELFHHGLVMPDGVTPSAGGREFVQVIDEMKLLTSAAAGSPTVAARSESAGASVHVDAVGSSAPARGATRVASALGVVTGGRRRRAASVASTPSGGMIESQPVGLLFDFDQLWYYRTLPQAKRWDQPRWLQMWYSAIARLGLGVKVLLPDRDLPSELPLIIAPGVQMVDDALVRRFDTYAGGGGNLVLTCRTGLMDRSGQLWEGPLAKPIVPLIGATIEAYDGLPDESFGEVEFVDGGKHPWGVWGDLLYAEPATKVLAKYASHFYSGAAAVTRAKRGRGTVTYCGVYAEPSFVDALVERLASDAEIPTTPLPPRVHLLKRGNHRILLNYQDQPVQAPAPTGARFIVGSTTVEPAGVAVWEA